MISAKNGLGIISGKIVNNFCRALCAENMFSTWGQESGTKFSAIIFLKCALYGLNIASN